LREKGTTFKQYPPKCSHRICDAPGSLQQSSLAQLKESDPTSRAVAWSDGPGGHEEQMSMLGKPIFQQIGDHRSSTALIARSSFHDRAKRNISTLRLPSRAKCISSENSIMNISRTTGVPLMSEQTSAIRASSRHVFPRAETGQSCHEGFVRM
jgi:hypothetical protein